MKWTAEDIPTLAGKKVLITGANSGLGFESAKALAGHGAHVIMACRNPQKAESSAAEIRALHPKASLELVPLDLSNLASVRALARDIQDRHAQLHVLINNAGIMAVPYAKTADGFELQFGTNHLGHFALTGLLFELLLKSPGARVVNIIKDGDQFAIVVNILASQATEGQIARFFPYVQTVIDRGDAGVYLRHVARERLIATFEQGYLGWLVDRAGGNMSRAARIAGVDRTTLYRLMEKHALHRDTRIKTK